MDNPSGSNQNDAVLPWERPIYWRLYRTRYVTASDYLLYVQEGLLASPESTVCFRTLVLRLGWVLYHFRRLRESIARVEEEGQEWEKEICRQQFDVITERHQYIKNMLTAAINSLEQAAAAEAKRRNHHIWCPEL
uniref:Uncharacterized protein n=1 Tax=Bracon brevicornis TaxID=1563983 RepID=A0A6V7JMN7_9HYME